MFETLMNKQESWIWIYAFVALLPFVLVKTYDLYMWFEWNSMSLIARWFEYREEDEDRFISEIFLWMGWIFLWPVTFLVYTAYKLCILVNDWRTDRLRRKGRL